MYNFIKNETLKDTMKLLPVIDSGKRTRIGVNGWERLRTFILLDSLTQGTCLLIICKIGNK